METRKTTGPVLPDLQPVLAGLAIAMVLGAAGGAIQALNLYIDAIPLGTHPLIVTGLITLARFLEGLYAQYKVKR